ncbi:DUF116 domain-containing protein [Thiovibrio sp. JS02]
MISSLPPWLSLPLLVFFYKPLSRLRPQMDKDAYVRKVVAAGNRFFYGKFVRIPYAERILFLPYCLRAEGCPTDIDPARGLICAEDCAIPCRVQEMRQMARGLGYLEVLVVVSGKIHKKEGVLRSRDFLMGQIERLRPRGVVGCLCSRDLREKYLRPENFSPRGTLGGHGGGEVIPQVCLLKNCNCRQSDVDWEELAALIRAPA